jgi:hypothetical protein
MCCGGALFEYFHNLLGNLAHDGLEIGVVMVLKAIYLSNSTSQRLVNYDDPLCVGSISNSFDRKSRKVDRKC